MIRLQIGELYCVCMIQNHCLAHEKPLFNKKITVWQTKNHCLLHDEMENIFKDELIQRVEVAVENKAVTMQTVEAKKNSYFQGLKKIVNLLQ